MAKKQIILFVLIVCLPLATLAWLGSRLAHEEQGAVRQRFRDVVLQRLEDVDRSVAAFFQQRRRELLALTDLHDFDPDRLREIVRRQPHIGQLFVLNPDGTLLHPDPNEPLNDSEREFLARNKEVFLDKELIRTADTESDEPAAHGWHLRYWGSGLNLIFHQRLPSGHVVGAQLSRSRWMADLIARLPETAPPARTKERLPAETRICLVDSNGRTVYQWGTLKPDESDKPVEPIVEMPLSHPLASWRLKYYVDEAAFSAVGRGAYFGLFGALAAVGIGLVVAAVYFYREYAREMREAGQRVNFVNQVSHELKTPLTNIRMYAELLENDLESLDTEASTEPRRHLAVIVAESQRLGRLIGNVLTFARQRRNKLSLRHSTVRPDEVIARVIERFEPALGQKGILTTFDGQATDPVRLDVDALEQILGNLISNVEKYAADGKAVDIVSRQETDRTTIVVADRGPGVTPSLGEHVFRPFYRISDRIEGTPGTGIGLSIARKLARLHGGDVVLQSSEIGARFEVRLHTPKAESEATA